MHALWHAWEWLFHVVMRLEPLRAGEAHLFYLSVRRYMGRPFVVDGVQVKRFDKVIELHMNNDLLLQVLRETDNLVSLAVRLLQIAKRDLPILAERVASRRFAKAHVLLGITFIHRSVERFGFQSFPIRGRFVRRVTTWHLRNVLRIVNPHADHLFRSHPDAFVPKVVAISKDRLIQQFACATTEGTTHVGEHAPA
jgi:hypothetical protein